MNSNTTTDETYDTLPEIDLPPVVDRLQHDLRKDLYEPCLSVADEYRRGVGFFTTQWFRETAAGMSAFVANGGTARWIVSPVLSEADYESLSDGFDARFGNAEEVMDIVKPQLEDIQANLEAETRNTVGWLIAEGIVDIKIAIPTEYDKAMYHDKFGVIVDGEGNRLSFHGSMNDSGQAFRNIEAYTLDCDWHGSRDTETVDYHAQRFEWLWKGDIAGIETHTLPEAAEKELLDLRTTDRPPYQKAASDGGTNEDQPTSTSSDEAEDADLRDIIDLREYQQEAVDAWVDNDYHGTFEMATGLGKTITAEAATDALVESLDQNVLVVVAVPENYLGRQWADELTDWGFDDPVMAFGSASQSWRKDLSGLVTDAELGIVSPGIAITTHDSFHKDDFVEHIKRADVPCMLIVDEVHGVGTQTRQEGLAGAYTARLGLSATPERYMDDEGTDALEAYFDGTVYEYGLEKGIPEYLSRYEYHPIVVELSEDEAKEYIAESQRLATTISSEHTTSEDIGRVAQQRAKIAKTAERKHGALTDVLGNLETQDGLIVFTHYEQMDAVTDNLHDHGIKYHRYTQHECSNKRERLIDEFGRVDGGLDALVGINCLDEGVDVSSAQTAILMASTGNPRQFVQRRGRVLRQDEGKDVAHIYDFVVIPPRSHFDDLLDSERSLLVKQLERHEEFAQTAENNVEATETVRELREAIEE